MLTGIDHVIIASADPDRDVGALVDQLGLTAGEGGRHQAAGTFNRLIWLGNSYIELMGVFDPKRAADHWWGSHVSRVLQNHPAAYAGAALATDDLLADVERLRGHASPILDPIDGQRVRPDGEVVRWRVGRLPEPDAEIGLTFLIEHDPIAAEWRPADRSRRAAMIHPIGTTAELLRLELPALMVGQTTTERLRRDLGLAFRPSLAGGGARDTSLGDQILRFVPAQRGVPPTIVMRAGDTPREKVMLGCRWRLEPITAR